MPRLLPAILLSVIGATGVTSSAGTLYQDTTPAGFGAPLSPEFIYLEEVLVPVARNPNHYGAIAVNQVTVQVSMNLPLTESVSLFWAPAGNDALGTPTPTLSGIFSNDVASGTVTGPAMGTSTTTLTFGTGATPLFTAPVNSTSVPGYDLFWVGLSGSGSPEDGEFEDWVGASGPDFNRDQAFVYDEFSSMKTAAAGSHYLIVNGEAVPEPRTSVMLALGLAALGVTLRRSRS